MVEAGHGRLLCRGIQRQGWAESVSGATWYSPPATATPRAPTTIPAYIGVIVTKNVTMQGSRAKGDVADVVVLKVADPAGYRADPGHPESGVLKAVVR